MSSETQKSILPLRAILGFVITTGVLCPQIYQSWLNSVYNWLYHSMLYNLSTYETILTVGTYIILEPLYTYKFGHNPALRIDTRTKAGAPERLPKMRRPSKRLGELFIYTAPLLLLDVTMIKKFAGVPINDIRASGGYAPLPVDMTTQSPVFSMFNHSGRNSTTTQTGHNKAISSHFLLPTLHNFSADSPLQLKRALPLEPPSSRRLILELATSLFIYDFLFFAFHLLLHRVRFLAKIHLPHHTHAEMHPQITNRLSVAERLGLVLLANFSLNIIGSHVLTRTLFVPIFVDLLIEVHCGMDLPWGYDKILPQGWGAGPREHARHHRTGEGNYAPFFTWWDKALHAVEGRGKHRKAS